MPYWTLAASPADDMRASQVAPWTSVALPWLAVAVASVLSREVVKGSSAPFLVLAAAAVGWLVLRGSLHTLVLLTTAALVLGSSSLPLATSDIVVWGKLALMAAVGLTAVVRPVACHASGASRGFTLAFLGLVALALLSAIYSVSPPTTLERASSLLILWLATAVAVPVWWRREGDLLALVRNIGLVAVATVLAGTVLGMIGVASAFGADRLQGVFGNPNTLGYFIAPIFPALVLMAASPGKQRGRSITLTIVAVLAVALVLSGSRGGVLSAIAGVTAGMVAAQPRRRRLAAVLLAGTVLGALVLARERPIRPEGGERFLEIGTGSGRAPAWQHGLELVADRPLLGYGFATTPIFFREVAPRPAEMLGRLHNSYLEVAVDLGWPGAFFLLTLALSGAWSAWRVARRRGPARSMGAILFAGIVGGITEGVSETGLLSAGGLLAFHFWLLVGAAHSLRVRAGREMTT